jgi:hypothetical protein
MGSTAVMRTPRAQRAGLRQEDVLQGHQFGGRAISRAVKYGGKKRLVGCGDMVLVVKMIGYLT